MGETFSSLVTDGPLLVAAGVAALVGLISFASPCVLPLVPGYLAYVSGLVGTGARRTPTPVRGRRDGDRRPHRESPRAPAWCSARCCSSSASPPSSSPFGAAFGGLGPAAAAVRRRPQPGLRRRHHRGRAGLPGLAAAAAAHQAARRRARRRAGRGAAAGHRLRPRLDAVPGPDAVRGLLAGLPAEATATRGARPRRRLLPGARACRSCWSRSAPAGPWGRRRSCAGTRAP